MTMIPRDILEATRLTRQGQLSQATALLLRQLGGQSTPAPAPQPAPGRRIIDVEPETGQPLPESPASTASRWHDRLLRGRGAATAQPQVPAGASFVARNFAGAAGSRGYKLYTPTHPDAAPALIVMLHGCTQSPDDFAAGTRMNALAEQHGAFVCYPQQTSNDNPQKCWNWFRPGDQRRDVGEPSLIAGITRAVMQEHGIDVRKVFIAGLSAGGAAAAVMAAAYPDLYAAVGVHSGLACGVARDIPTAFAAMRGDAALPIATGGRMVPTIVFHADRDATVHHGNAEQVVAQAMSRGNAPLTRDTQRGQVPGGHAYTRATQADAAGRVLLEHWTVHGGGHAWSGGDAAGSYTDPKGPDASREMLRFFLHQAM